MRAWLAVIILMLSPMTAHAGPDDRLCDITLMFGSECCGTDHETYQDVKAILEERRALASYRRIPWGREGEFTLCVSVRSARDIRPLYDELKGALPTESDKTRGYTTIRLQRELEDE